MASDQNPPPPLTLPFNVEPISTFPLLSFGGCCYFLTLFQRNYIRKTISSGINILWLNATTDCKFFLSILKFLTVEDHDTGRVSASYLAWEQQDQLLLSWLQSSISCEMLGCVIGCKSLWQLWEKIHIFICTLMWSHWATQHYTWE